MYFFQIGINRVYPFNLLGLPPNPRLKTLCGIQQSSGNGKSRGPFRADTGIFYLRKGGKVYFLIIQKMF